MPINFNLLMISDKNRWEKLLDDYPEANFLQSWEWGEFHQNIGHNIYRVSFDKGMFLAVVETAKRARYITVPGGPLLKDYFSVSLWKQAISLMKELAWGESCAFIRIRPQALDTPKCRDLLDSFGWRPSPMHLHAQLTRILDVTLTDEELLKHMRKSTRYEIRKALRTNIKVIQSDDERLFEEFMRLQDQTANREHFTPFSKNYLLEQFKAFKENEAVKLFSVSHPDSFEVLAMAFVIFYRKEVTYHYAVSSASAREIPASYAIQWAIIQEAKKRGCKTYNLWGDVRDDQLSAGLRPRGTSTVSSSALSSLPKGSVEPLRPKGWRTHRFATYHSAHRFAGPSLFKRGFGGHQVAYLPAYDLPLSLRYWPNWGIEIFRAKWRNLL